MDNNIYCKIEEKEMQEDNKDFHKDFAFNNEYTICNENESNIILCNHLIDESEYNIMNLNNINLICDYYNIKKGKNTKKEKILQILIFENNPENFDIVENRKLLWEYIKVIKSDKLIGNYLLLDI